MIIPHNKITRATDQQRYFLEILLSNCGLTSTRKQRNAWLSAELHRNITYLDEISKTECSQIIETLRKLKMERIERIDNATTDEIELS